VSCYILWEDDIMYIQVTTKCNMKCKHCLYDCKAIGHDMSFELFKSIIDVCNFDECHTIGGGEPTLHPQLIEMLSYAVFMTEYKDYIPTMITNGTCSEKVWKALMRARKAGNLFVHVSYDSWHDTNMINDYVYDDAQEHGLWWGANPKNEIMGRHRPITKMGRGRITSFDELNEEAEVDGYQGIEYDNDSCCDTRIDPLGRVWVDYPDKKGRPILIGEFAGDYQVIEDGKLVQYAIDAGNLRDDEEKNLIKIAKSNSARLMKKLKIA
jgi:hypothetical protein